MKQLHLKAYATVLIVALLVGCTTLYSGVVSVTSVVDTAMKAWAQLSVKGSTTPAIDARVVSAHDKYRAAAAVTQAALIQYKSTGNSEPYLAALESAKTAASGLVDLIVPLLLPKDAASLQNNLAKATTL